MRTLSEVTDELLEYFEMYSNDWPMLSVYHNGTFVSGVVSDELYSILIEMRELRESDEQDS